MMSLYAPTNHSGLLRITVATMFSFIAAALSSASFFCYSAIASASVVLILPVSPLSSPINVVPLLPPLLLY